jgi:hypothetical protein
MKYISASLKYAGVVIAALVLLLSTAVMPASAASAGLSITPRKDYQLEPGKTVTDKLQIGNLDNKQDLTVSLRVIDFSFMDDSGSPKLMVGENMPQTTWSAKPFISLPKTVSVGASKTVTVPMTVKIPAGQGAGSFYSAIQYSSQGENGGNVNLSASGVSLVFITVPGTVNEKMSVVNLGNWQRNKDGVTGKYIKIATDESPSIVGFTLKNDGNVVESPAGSVTLKDTFGNEVKGLPRANANANLALIGQSRRFENCINPVTRKVERADQTVDAVTCGKTSLKPGRYTVTLSAFYGQNGNPTHEINASASFWYLPLWFLIVLGVVLLIIIYIIWRIKRMISKARGTNKPGGGNRFKLKRS